MKRLVAVVALCLSVMSAHTAYAEQALKFADVLTDNMVLQRDKELKCWGLAPAGSKVEVLLTQSRDDVAAFAGEGALARETAKSAAKTTPGIGKVRLAYIEEEPVVLKPVTKTVVADKDGRWEVILGKHAASFTPTYLAARSGDARIAIQNLLIGEVWIASGQSNMKWAWTRDKMWENKGLLFNGIRYAVVSGDSGTPIDSFTENGKSLKPWIVCEDGAVDDASTVAYLFAQYLHRRLKVPVGVINIAEGGSYAREWCARELLEKMGSATVTSQLKEHNEKAEKDPKAKDGRGPSSLFNARLYPIRHMTVAGVIYLQGENEALTGDLPQYLKTFPGVIQSYRTALGSPNLPFGIITLQGMGEKSDPSFGSYVAARAIHQMVQKETPNTGYIVAHDVGGGIHPNWKRPLAERAVYWALRDVYRVLEGVKQSRIKKVSFDGTRALVEFETMQLKDGVWTNAEPSLPDTNDQQGYAGFSIAGEDRVWYTGRIAINDDPPKGLHVSHSLVSKPVALRYAWDSYSPANIGAWSDPVPPYRTDDWPIVTDDFVSKPGSGKLSAGELRYLEDKQMTYQKMELPMKIAVADSYENLTKRYADPKGMLLSTVDGMQQLMKNFNDERCGKLSSDMRQNALYSIPCRYWNGDKYTPERRAKWGWIIERIIRLEHLPEKMQQTLAQSDVKAKIAKVDSALTDLQTELKKLPEPETMDFDTMLNKVLPVMDAEKERLSKEGVDMKRQSNALSSNPF